MLFWNDNDRQWEELKNEVVEMEAKNPHHEIDELDAYREEN